MKQGLLLAFFAISLFITSCSSSDDKDGNWSKNTTSEYSGSGRGGAVSFTIGDDVYLGLGYSNGDFFNSFYKYNLDNGNWVNITEKDDDKNEIGIFPGKARRDAVAFSINGKGYIGTGFNEDDVRVNDFWEYDPLKDIANRWTQIADLPGGIRQGAVAFAFDTNDDGINDVAYVGTGYGVLDNEDQKNLKDFYKFEDGSWVDYTSSYGGGKTNEATTFIIGTKGYLVSGVNNLDKVWEIDGKTGQWLKKNDIDKEFGDENVQRTKAVAFVIDNLAYITTGSGTNSREVWEYKPGSGKEGDWVERNDLENEVFSRVDAIGISIDNRGFIVTGLSGTQGLSDMWEFIPGVREDDRDN